MRKLLIVLVAFALVIVYTVPGIAGQRGFYGSARVWAGTPSGDDDLLWFQHGTGLNLRRLYGTWRFGTGTLLVAQAYTLVDTMPSNMVWNTDDGLNSYGFAYSGRLDQLKLTVGGLEVALIDNGTTSSVATDTETDTSIARLEASYSFKVGPVAIKPFFGYNTHDDVIAIATNEKSYIIDCSLFGAMAQFPVGALTISLGAYSARNSGNYGLAEDGPSFTIAGTSYSIANAFHNTTTVPIEHVTSRGSALALNYKASDMITVEGGYSLIHNEIDQNGVRTEAQTRFFYIQAPITLAKDVWIIPEFGTIDYGDLKMTGTADTKLGDISYYSAKWEIRF